MKTTPKMLDKFGIIYIYVISICVVQSATASNFCVNTLCLLQSHCNHTMLAFVWAGRWLTTDHSLAPSSFCICEGVWYIGTEQGAAGHEEEQSMSSAYLLVHNC